MNAKNLKDLNNQQRSNLYTYQGFYNNNFIRSSWEYIFCKYLEYRDVNYKVELKRYQTPMGMYTPDFFIFGKNKKLKAIIEIKPKRFINTEIISKLEFVSKIENVKTFIIDYNDLYKRIQRTNYTFHTLQVEWKTFAESKINHGRLNPMYGLKHSQITKNLISEKAKARYKDNPELGKKIGKKHRVKKIKLNCPACENKFFVLPSEEKGDKYKRKYCSRKCSETQNKKRSLIAKNICNSNKINQELQKKFFSILSIIDIDSVKINKIKTTFWIYLNDLFEQFQIKDKRTFIFRITGKHNIPSRTFVTSLRSHRNSIMPF